MINPDFEISRFRHNLMFQGYDQREADVIAGHIHDDVNNRISELVVGAISEATQIADNLGIPEFGKQVKAVKMGGTYTITTESGKVDFSTEARQMLPGLLKNAKVAKDGSLYKVIPMKKSRPTSSMEAQISLDENRKAMMDSVKAEIGTGASVVRGSGAFSGLNAAKQFVNRRNELKSLASQSGETEFRTASSKQNSSTMWVQPPKQQNMSTILVDINRKLEDDIQQTIIDLIKLYEEQFL